MRRSRGHRGSRFLLLVEEMLVLIIGHELGYPLGFFLLHDLLCDVHPRERKIGCDLTIGEPGSDFLLEDLELVLHLRVDVALGVGQDPARERIANLVSIRCEGRMLSFCLHLLLLLGL